MVIWPAFRMEQYRVNDHPYHAPQFILLLKYVLFILFGFFRDRVNFDDYHRENIYLYDWPILMIITIFADIYNWFMRFT